MRVSSLILCLLLGSPLAAQTVISGSDGVITVERDGGNVETYEYDPPEAESGPTPRRKTVYYRFGSLPQHEMNASHAHYFHLRDVHRFVLRPYLQSLPEVVYVEPRRRVRYRLRRH